MAADVPQNGARIADRAREEPQAPVASAEDRLAADEVPKTVELVDAVARSEATRVNRGRLVEAIGG